MNPEVFGKAGSSFKVTKGAKRKLFSNFDRIGVQKP